MTKASEVTVSDAELTRIQEAAFVKTREGLRSVIAEVIAARVPDAVADQGDDSYPSFGVWEAGHNALRVAVLRGPG